MYIIKKNIPYTDLTGLAVSPENLPGGWENANWVKVSNYVWDETGYCPDVRAAAAMNDGGMTVMMLANEETISGTVKQVGGGVCVDSCMECFFIPFEGDERYLNVEVNCIGTAHIAVGEGRNGRSVWTELPEGVQVSASRHENGWWAMSFHIPGDMLMEVYGKRLTDGGIVRGNFYKCDETIHPHFGTWNPVVAPQPDFHRPECFGQMQVEA